MVGRETNRGCVDELGLPNWGSGGLLPPERRRLGVYLPTPIPHWWVRSGGGWDLSLEPLGCPACSSTRKAEDTPQASPSFGWADPGSVTASDSPLMPKASGCSPVPQRHDPTRVREPR